MGELKAAELSDDEHEPSEEDEAAQINSGDELGGHTFRTKQFSKRYLPKSGLRTSSRLVHQHRVSTNHFKSSDNTASDYENFHPTLLENEDKEAFRMMRLPATLKLKKSQRQRRMLVSYPMQMSGFKPCWKTSAIFGRREVSRMKNRPSSIKLIKTCSVYKLK